MNALSAKIEALLFLRTKPMSTQALSRALGATKDEIEQAVEALMTARNVDDAGVHVVKTSDGVALVTNPAFGEELAEQSKEDMQSELTRPQLETLTIIAYRGPITKAEIEHIRGVNCSIIVRNLLMRGLIDEREDDVKLLPVYSLTTDMLRHLGIHKVDELPDYEALHKNAKIDQMLHSLDG